MATREQLENALRNASAAADQGDQEAAQAARRFANELKAMGPAAPASAPAATPPEPSFADAAQSVADGATRQAGLGFRHAIDGLAGTAGIVYDPLAVAGNKLLPGDPFMSASSLGKLVGNAAGLPEPADGYERLTGGALRGLAGTGGIAALGRGLGGAVGGALSAKPVAQMVAGATGGGAAEGAREAGLPLWAQVGAGVVGSLAPAAGAGSLRTLLRGAGADNQASMLDRIAQFRSAGAGAPTVGQATERAIPRGLDALLGKAPGSSGVMAGAVEAQQAGMGQRVGALADSLSRKASPEQAGRAIERGISGPGGFVESFRATAKRLYNTVDQFIPGTTPIPVTRTKATLDQLASPTPGAAETSRALTSNRIADLRSALDADLQASIAAAGRGELPYEAVKALRSRLGELIQDASLNPDLPTKQLKAVYGALSDDLGAAVAATNNPSAINAAQRANTYFKAAMGRLEAVERVVERNGGPEKVFSAAMSASNEGATTLRAVLQSLPEEGQKALAAAVLRRMGRATPGKQNEVGELFSSETFLTNWNRLSRDAQRALSDRFGPRFAQDLDTIAATAANMRAGSKVLQNVSGSAAAGAQLGTAAAFAMSLLGGNLPVAGGIAAGAGLANGAARAMTNPRVVEWLAQATKVPAAALPMQIAKLKAEAQASGDEEALEIARQLEEQAVNQPAYGSQSQQR